MKKFLCSVALAFVACAAWAQQIGPQERITPDPEVRMGRLDNGLTYYIRHNDKPAGMADFYIVHNIGAVQEDDTQTGLAHFLEHLAFNGTENLPGHTMINWGESIGIQQGRNLNASTQLEWTIYMLGQVPLRRESIVDSALLVLHDWSGFVTLDDKEIDKERGVIVEERRQVYNANRRIMAKTSPFLFGETRYGYRDLIGSEEFLRTFPYSALRDFYKKWYHPEHQAMVIVGDFDVDRMEAKLRKVMSDIPAAIDPQPRNITPIPDNVEPQALVATDYELNYSTVSLYIKHPMPERNDMDLMSRVYNDALINAGLMMANTRLEELAKSAEPPFNAAKMGWTPLNSTKMALTMGANAKEGKLPQAFEAAYTELERIRRYGFTGGEMAITKSKMLNNIENAYANRENLQNGHYATMYVENFTKGSPMPSAEDNYARNLRFLEQMDLRQVNEAFRRLITPTNNVIVAITPEKKEVAVPEADEFLAAMERVKKAEIEPYADDFVARPLIPATIDGGRVKRDKEGMYGSRVWTLSNGVRVVVKPSKLEANKVEMIANAHGGVSMLDDADEFTSRMLEQVVRASGVGEFSDVELQKQLAGRTAKVDLAAVRERSPRGTDMPLHILNRFSTGLKGVSSSKDIEAMLQLTYLRFTAPRFDKEKFDQLQQQTQTYLRFSEATSADTFDIRVHEATYGDNPRVKRQTTENIGETNFSRMPTIYNTFFDGTADNYTFFFIGDFELETLKPLVAKYIGALPTGKGKLTSRNDGIERRMGAITERFETMMREPKSTIYFNYHGPLEYTLENNMTMRLLSECLHMRFFQSIREERGGSYGVRVDHKLRRLPEPHYELTINFDTDPAMADELIEVVKAELHDMAKNGPRDEDIAKNLEYWIKSRTDRLEKNEIWRNLLVDYYTWGQEWYEPWSAEVEALRDGTKVKALMQKILDDGNVINVVMEPTK